MSKSAITAKIDLLLAKQGIRKSQFYKDCGISSACYSQWNTAKTFPRLANLSKISEYLGVSLEDLLSEEQQNETKPVPETGNELTEMQHKAMNLIMEMSDSQLRVFIAALEAAKQE